MASKVVDNTSSGLTGLIKIVFLFLGLFAVIVWAKSSPDTFQSVVNELLDTGARLIIWVCQQIQAALPAPSGG